MNKQVIIQNVRFPFFHKPVCKEDQNTFVSTLQKIIQELRYINNLCGERDTTLHVIWKYTM